MHILRGTPRRFAILVTFALVLTPPQALLHAQESGSKSSAVVSDKNSPDQPITFKAKVNLVLVRVVVRAAKGEPVTGLVRDDFRVFDNGNLQTISLFERAAGSKAEPMANAASPVKREGKVAIQPSVLPHRLLAYVFDDVHLRPGDLAQARAALLKEMTRLQPGDRVALYTTTFRHMVEFTDDLDKVRAVLPRITPYFSDDYASQLPPALTYYAADQILNKEGDSPLMPFTANALMQLQVDPLEIYKHPERLDVPLGKIRMAARDVLANGNRETGMTVSLLKEVVRRLAVMPGEREIAFVSSGFYVPRENELGKIIDDAIRAHITVNSLSARGVQVLPVSSGSPYAPALPDASAGTGGPRPPEMWLSPTLGSANLRAVAQSLQDLANGTGGNYIGNNDFRGFFQHTNEIPDSYLLGFKPSQLKMDGAFHSLKVRLRRRGLVVQARRGYFVPSHPADPAQAAREEVERAMFSEDEIHEIPVSVSTHYSKASGSEGTLSVVAHLDISVLPLRKTKDVNEDDVLLYAGLFDHNGNYVAGEGQTAQLRLRDETLARGSSGMDLKTSIAAPPGKYILRVVVHDREGELTSAVNQTVEMGE